MNRDNDSNSSMFDQINPFFRKHDWPEGCSGERCPFEEAAENAEKAFDTLMGMHREYEDSIRENAQEAPANNLLESYTRTAGLIEVLQMLQRNGYMNGVCPFRIRMFNTILDSEQRCAIMLEEEVKRRIDSYGDIDRPEKSILDKLRELLSVAQQEGRDVVMKKFNNVDDLKKFMQDLINDNDTGEEKIDSD